jgi:hypothetical protein
MWLPAFAVPARIAPDAWTRHAVARLGASTLAATVLIGCPHALPALARWADAACLLQALTGLPCLGCGITTSLLALGRGDVAASWAANPAGLAVAGLLVGQALVAAAVLRPTTSPAGVPLVVGLRWLSWLDRAALGSLLAAWVARLVGVVA